MVKVTKDCPLINDRIAVVDCDANCTYYKCDKGCVYPKYGLPITIAERAVYSSGGSAISEQG